MSPEIIALLFVGAVLIVTVILIIVRRRRTDRPDDLPLPEIAVIGEPIDYTSLPEETPRSLGERFRAAPPAVKALVLLAPVVLVGVIVTLLLTFGGLGGSATVPTSEPLPQPRLVVERAEVVGAGKIVVVVQTENLPAGATLTVLMREGDQEFPWFNPETALAQPDPLSGEAQIVLDRRSNAPIPRQDATYTVIAIASDQSGEIARSDPTTLDVLRPFVNDFYAIAAEPTVAPALTPTATQPPATPEPSPTVIEATRELTGTATIAGNIRREPNREAEVLGRLAPGEVVTLVERSIDGEWYRITTSGGLSGWVSRTLLVVDQGLAAQLPVATPTDLRTASVFNGGNVRTSPSLRGLVIDQINAGESVLLLARNADSTWLKIINERKMTGWVSRTLLTIAPDDLRRLPVSNETVPTPLPATVAALPPPPTPRVTVPPATGLTAIVFNGGNVRAAPNLQGRVLDQINARETVQLLSKTPDGNWYRITNVRGVTGWVNRTLLTVDPNVARRVPVGQ
ncbi:MAG: SH3 domain-containing protein [Roseiflexus sp.]|jgi:SH3 domain protein|nr:SH3 domain-containing protein [Roseiflexus sp.]MBO9333297.1 SH3 domain-containing protein [Roseiflexus sp.]MBO9364512.1 SH3 domain-containing protein [Roseiflexus sp.]MBO9381648.1 SH3 domain-containing protein [Roseiflexus sp.]MBO9387463.1 SH3 domain-containing protein [Roseiflexus sp.]